MSGGVRCVGVVAVVVMCLAMGGSRVGQVTSGTTEAAGYVDTWARLNRRVTLVPPYPEVYPGSPRDKLSVQYVALVLAQKVGLRYGWTTSYANTNPDCRRWVRPDFRNVRCCTALQATLEGKGLVSPTDLRLTYTVVGQTIVLERKCW